MQKIKNVVVILYWFVMPVLSALIILGLSTSPEWLKAGLVGIFCFIYWSLGKMYFIPWDNLRLDQQFENLYRLRPREELVRNIYFGIVRPIWFGVALSLLTAWTIGNFIPVVKEYNLVVSVSNGFWYGLFVFAHYFYRNI